MIRADRRCCGWVACLLALVTLGLWAAASAAGAEIEGRYSGALWNAWDTWRNHRATQVMRLEPQKDDWPAFALRPYTNTREGDNDGLLLGSIIPGDMTAKPSGVSPSSRNNWTSMALQYSSGALTLTLSRLSPAARLDIRGDTVHLFSNLKYERAKGDDKQIVFPRPKYVAFAGADGRVHVRAAPARVDCAEMSQNWMLFWFGDQTPYRSSRFPMTTGYLWGVPTPGIYFAQAMSRDIIGASYASTMAMAWPAASAGTVRWRRRK